MARGSRKLILDYSPRAISDLDEIWDWNAKQRGASHADRYIAFLKTATEKLTRILAPGRPVPTSTLYRYALLRGRTKGFGHLVVFSIEGPKLRVWRYFHTSQDWESRLD